MNEQSVIARKRYHKDKDFRNRIQEANKKWYQKNKDYFKTYYKENPEKLRKANLKWQHKNRTRVLKMWRDYSRNYRLRQKENNI